VADGGYNRLMMRAVVFLLGLAVLGQGRPAHAQDTRDIVGYVRTVEDSTVLPGVAVEVIGLPNSATTDTGGFFALRRLPARDHRIVFRRLGLTSDTLVVAVGTDSVYVYLVSHAVQLAPVIASAESPSRRRFEESAQASAVTIDAEIIQEMPALLEADVIRTIQLLPGTIAVNDYTVGYNARGGEADQNLIQLDGVTIFNPSHLGGLFSTFDAAAVGDIDYLTGGFPAHYAGRLSSVLDVRTRPGRTRFGVSGQISLLSSKILFEGPLPVKHSSFLVAARRTYADRVITWFTSKVLPYYFADGVAKVMFALPTGGTLSLTGYMGSDVLRWEFAQIDPDVPPLALNVDWGNRLLGLNYNDRVFGKRLEVHTSVTEFSTTVGFVPNIVQIDNDVRLLTANVQLWLSEGATHDVRIGGGVDDYRMLYNFRSDALSTVYLDQTYQPRVWSAFVDDQWRPSDWLLIRPGVRVEAVQGGADVTTVAPRLAAKAFLTRDFALTGSVGRYYQPIHSLRDHNSPWSFVDFWIGADSATPVGRADHVVLGFERWFNPSLSLSVEGYWKTFSNVLNYNIADDNKVRGDEFVVMEGNSWGFDLLLRKFAGNWNGWLSYSFGKSLRQDPVQEFSPAHDRRHFLNLVVNGPGPLGSRMSIRWGYGSPMPYTDVLGEWTHREYSVGANAFNESENEPIADPRLNRARYPHYSRLDLSFRWQARVWGGVLRPFLQIVNLYNRGNVFLYVFDYTTSPGTRQGISQLPFIPSFGVEFEF
jgi:hypothetical protein